MITNTAEKQCFKCLTTKPLSEFYRHSQMEDGHLNKCKECAKSDTKKNYEENIEHYKEYDRNRARLSQRVEARSKYQKEHVDLVNKIKYKWIKNNPEKRRAHIAVGNAIKSGKLVRQSCESCGELKTEAHHDDYSKPLDVRWLCKKCHTKHHHSSELKQKDMSLR